MLNLTIESQSLLVLAPQAVEPGNCLTSQRGDDPKRRRYNPAVSMNEFQWQHYVRFQDFIRRSTSPHYRIAVSRRVRFCWHTAIRSSGDDNDDGGSSGDAHALLGICPQRAKRFSLVKCFSRGCAK